MSNAYLFFLLTDEIIEWVQSCGGEVLSGVGEIPAKVPEITDFLQVIEAIPDLRVEQFESQFLIESIHGENGRWASLSVYKDEKDENCSNVSIERVGEDQLYNELVQGVVDLCGPLLIYNTYDVFDVRLPSK